MLHLLVHWIWFFVHGGIVEFRSLQVHTHEGNGLLIVQLVLLCEHQNEWSVGKKYREIIFVEVWGLKCWCLCYFLLDTSECILFLLSPIVHDVLRDHLLNGFNNLCIIRDELYEEVDIPQERLHGFLVHGVRNLCDGQNSIWIYLDRIFHNYVSKQVTLRHYKYALLGIQAYPVFSTSLKFFLKMVQVVWPWPWE